MATWFSVVYRQDLGWGLLNLRSSISPAAKFAILQKYLFVSLYHINIWHASTFGSVNGLAVNRPGVGLLSRIPLFYYFHNFSTSPKYMLAIEYHVHIWQLSQLSCGDTCQIWMRFKECSRYFCEIEKFAYGEIDERSFSNPHPWQQRWLYKSCQMNAVINAF